MEEDATLLFKKRTLLFFIFADLKIGCQILYSLSIKNIFFTKVYLIISAKYWIPFTTYMHSCRIDTSFFHNFSHHVQNYLHLNVISLFLFWFIYSPFIWDTKIFLFVVRVHLFLNFKTISCSYSSRCSNAHYVIENWL